jgi:regulatory protein
VRKDDRPAGGWRAEDELDPPGDPEAVARQICLGLLDKRARTRAELATVLTRRGIPDSAATLVLDRFTEIGLIDDVELAQSFALARHNHRGLARPVIAAQLRRRGVGDDAIGQALAQIDPASEVAAALALAQNRLRRMSALDRQTQTRRLMGLLGRRGYSSAVCSQAVREALRAGAGSGHDRFDGSDEDDLPLGD